MKKIITTFLSIALLHALQAQPKANGDQTFWIRKYLLNKAKEIIPSTYFDHPEFGTLSMEDNPATVELIHLRTADSRTFLGEEGKYYKQQTAGTFNYKDAQQRWISMQDKVSIKGDFAGIFQTELPLFVDLTNGNTHLSLDKVQSVSFGRNSSFQVLDKEGETLSSIRSQYNRGLHKVEHNEITLTDYFTDIDRVQNLTYWDLQTDFLVKRKMDFGENAAFIQFEDHMKFPAGWKLGYGEGTMTENGWQGTLRILNEKGEVLSTISRPLLYDSFTSERKEDYSGHGSMGFYVVEATSDGYFLRLRVPLAWLNSDKLVYPVRIDPTATNTYASIQGLQDRNTTFSSSCQATMNVSFPVSYFQVTGTNITYTIRAKGYIASSGSTDYFGDKDEQRSRVGVGSNWTATQNGVGIDHSGSANDYAYSLTNQTIANGCYSGVSSITYNWQGYQTFFPTGSPSSTNVSGCVTNYQELRANTWIVTTTYTEKQFAVEWVSSSTGAATWCAGETRSVSVTVKNAGTQSWTSASGTNINFSYWWGTGQHRDYNPRMFPFANLAPGQSQTVTFNVTAPASGANVLRADLVREGVCWFSGNTGGCGPCNSELAITGQTIAAAIVINAGTDASTCVGVPRVLSASVTGASSYSWAASSSLSSTSILNPTASPAVTTTYTLTAGNGTCSLTDDVVITVNNPSSASLAANDLLFTGAVSTTYENASNWLKWNGTSFAVPATVPQITDNVRIKPNATCIVNQPTVTNLSDAGFTAPISVSANCKNIVIESGATLTFSSSNSHFHVSEIWSNSGTLVPANGRVKFIGTGAQSIVNAAGAESFYEMNVGGNSITSLNATNVTVTSALRLNGIVVPGSNVFHLSNSAADATSLPVLTGHVYGTFRRSIAANTNVYAFPVGVGTTITTNRRLLEFINGNIVGVTYLDCSVSNTFKGSGNNTDANLDPLKAKHYLQLFTSVSPEAQWTLNSNAAPSLGSYGVRLYLQNFAAVTDNNFAVLRRPVGSTTFFDFNSFYLLTSIPILNAAGRIFNSGNGYGQKSGFTSFGANFAIASSPVPLPVELLDFSAQCTENKVSIYWSTASEMNSQKFVIEKSRDMENWVYVSEQPSAGNSNHQIDYAETDENLHEQISYYRLRQVDFNGAEKIYGPISVSCENTGNSLTVFPNPAQDNFTVGVESAQDIKDAEIQIVDVSGRIVSMRVLSILTGANQVLFNGLYIEEGTYIVRLASKEKDFKPVKVLVTQ